MSDRSAPEAPADQADQANQANQADQADDTDTADHTDSVAVSVSGLRRTFRADPPVAALDGVDLEIIAGSFTAILGPSGSGKTTLLRVVAGTERADSGAVLICGRLVDGHDTHVVAERRRVGLVPQEGALFPHLDVARNVGFGLHKVPRAERAGRVADLLDLVGLAGMGSRRPHELSGGQAQRVALARALAPKPDVVLLDEPFSALDASLRTSLRAEVAEMLRATGTTAVLVTHDQDEAMSMADTVAIMRAGRIVQIGAPDDLYRRPTDLWVAGFLGDAVILDGDLSSAEPDGTAVVRCELGDVEAVLAATDPPEPGPVRWCCRPEQLWPVSVNGVAIPSPDGSGPLPSSDVYPAGRPAAGVVTHTAFRGSVIDVSVQLGTVTVSARWPSSITPAEVGDTVELIVLGAGVAYRCPAVDEAGDEAGVGD